ncbi:hypothetical protein WPG_0579 [Winogradskyella sp. PG-2]|nr:hypothetical protein WPG_0579 [Winogradskyella sp. PG-2]
MKKVKIGPPTIIEYTSLRPTVVSVTMDHQRLSKIEEKCSKCA